jgi:hypothetical protein
MYLWQVTEPSITAKTSFSSVTADVSPNSLPANPSIRCNGAEAIQDAYSLSMKPLSSMTRR